MSQTLNTAITVIGIDIGKNSFHIVDLDWISRVGIVWSVSSPLYPGERPSEQICPDKH